MGAEERVEKLLGRTIPPRTPGDETDVEALTVAVQALREAVIVLGREIDDARAVADEGLRIANEARRILG